jgi:hypothetical protein
LVSILASALPGFRDIRAALVAGYLWLLFGWLLLGGTLKNRRDLTFVAELVEIAQAAGPIWTVLALGMGAYLVGLISRDLSRLFRTLMRQLQSVRWEVAETRVSQRRAEQARRIAQREGRHGHDLPGVSETPISNDGGDDGPSAPPQPANVLTAFVEVALETQKLFLSAFANVLLPWRRLFTAPPILVATAELLPARVKLSLDSSDPIVRQLVEDRARQAQLLIPGVGTLMGGEVSGAEISEGGDAPADPRRLAVQQALMELTDGLRRELDLPATLLVGEQPELFAEADRIGAESELRSAVVPPLMALAILLSIQASVLWLIALIPIAQLMVQAVRREDDARRLIGSALLFGRARSGAVERFDRDLAELAALSQNP